jgi:hypothetical protein
MHKGPDVLDIDDLGVEVCNHRRLIVRDNLVDGGLKQRTTKKELGLSELARGSLRRGTLLLPGDSHSPLTHLSDGHD